MPYKKKNTSKNTYQNVFQIGERVMASGTSKREGPLHEAVITDRDDETNSYEIKWEVAGYKQFIATDMIHAYDEYLADMETSGRSRRRSRGGASADADKPPPKTDKPTAQKAKPKPTSTSKPNQKPKAKRRGIWDFSEPTPAPTPPPPSSPPSPLHAAIPETLQEGELSAVKSQIPPPPCPLTRCFGLLPPASSQLPPTPPTLPSHVRSG